MVALTPKRHIYLNVTIGGGAMLAAYPAMEKKLL
jgi:hypothetical protein